MNNNTLSKRRTARLMAVQTLYTQEIEQKHNNARPIAESTEDTLFLHHRLQSNMTPDKEFLDLLITGVNAQRSDIDTMITDHLAQNWKIERLDTVQRAILRAGVFEIRALRELSINTIINEYIELAHAFLNEEESKFTNAILDKIAKKVRGE